MLTTPQLSVYFFLQVAAIILICRIVGKIAQKFGQSQVVGEMIAGVMLGPSLFGLLAPSLQQALFPKQTMDILYVGGQLGVGLYMFLVGTGFKSEHFKGRARSAVSVSVAGIAVPFLLAMLMTPWLTTLPGLFAERIKSMEAALFLGAAIAITAFPMLARIIHERKMSDTPLGTLALCAGAVDDAAAWCILAIVLASFGGGWSHAYLAISGGICYGLFMIFVGRKLLRHLEKWSSPTQPLSSTVMAITLILFCLSAWAMDAIGIHAVFGGFILGAVLPHGHLTEKLREQLEPFVVIFLLPMFFTYSGLKTSLSLAFESSMILVSLAILAASFGGKGIACWAAARLSGVSNRDAIAIGSLMNARGLMELIIINIGLQAGVIQPSLFSILVLMAITSTLMATPLFNFSRHPQAKRTIPVASQAMPKQRAF